MAGPWPLLLASLPASALGVGSSNGVGLGICQHKHGQPGRPTSGAAARAGLQLLAARHGLRSRHAVRPLGG